MKKIILIGSYLPRKCGIASFTYDLYKNICLAENECIVMAVNDGENYDYPPEVKFQINQHIIEDYVKASDFINAAAMDAVYIQHEFGIYGGENGKYLIELIKRLKIPIVTTLHTILDTPSPEQKSILEQIGIHSSHIVVMSGMGKKMLSQIYKIPESKIHIIGHGIPNPAEFRLKNYKEELGIENKKVLLTFGLLSKSKGIETALRALPKILKKHPDTVYVVLGASHPHIIRSEGENYRHSLLNLTRKLDLTAHVVFIDKFVTQEELFGFLQMSDIYIIPYLSEKQITSGTLAYAMATHNAIISTPFWHAQEALSGGKGIFFEFNNSSELVKSVNKLLDNHLILKKYQMKAADYARQFDWKKIGEKYLSLFKTISQYKLDQFYKLRENEQVARTQTRSLI